MAKHAQAMATGGESSVTRIWSTAGSPDVVGTRTPSQADAENRPPQTDERSAREPESGTADGDAPLWIWLLVGLPFVVGIVVRSCGVADLLVHSVIGTCVGLTWALMFPLPLFATTAEPRTKDKPGRKRILRFLSALVRWPLGLVAYVVWAGFFTVLYFYFVTYTSSGRASTTASPFGLLNPTPMWLQTYGPILGTMAILGPIGRLVVIGSKKKG